MYEHHHSHDFNPYAQQAEQVQPAELAAPSQEPGREADPYEVINFLLKKVEEQQTRITEHEGFIELMNQETEQLKGQLEASQQALESTQRELETQVADYDVLMQNTLAVERELESFKAKVSERPKISLPFHTEQKLAKLGFSAEGLEEREAV
jgi:chromosome segregation ATPase